MKMPSSVVVVIALGLSHALVAAGEPRRPSPAKAEPAAEIPAVPPAKAPAGCRRDEYCGHRPASFAAAFRAGRGDGEVPYRVYGRFARHSACSPPAPEVTVRFVGDTVEIRLDVKHQAGDPVDKAAVVCPVLFSYPPFDPALPPAQVRVFVKDGCADPGDDAGGYQEVPNQQGSDFYEKVNVWCKEPVAAGEFCR